MRNRNVKNLIKKTSDRGKIACLLRPRFTTKILTIVYFCAYYVIVIWAFLM